MHSPAQTDKSKDTNKRKDRVQAMFSSIAGRYDLLNTILSFGMHHYWRRAALNMSSGSGGAALDVCTGSGDLAVLLAKRGYQVTAVDFCQPLLDVAARKFKRLGLDAALLFADALKLPFAEQSFDLVTAAFGVRNFEDLSSGLKEMWRVLKPGGRVLILEFGLPPAAPLRFFYSLYARYLMPLIGGLISGNHAAYSYLPKSAAEFPCGPAFCEMLKQRGFSEPNYKALSFGIAYAYAALKSA